MRYDAVIVGSGPNGLTAAVVLARAGAAVLVLEAEPTIGGGTRTEQLTLPGFLHDVCSAVHPLAAGSPIFNELPLAQHGLEWIHAPILLAHPLDDGNAVLLARSLDATADALGADGEPYRDLVAHFAARWHDVVYDTLRPIRMPRSPFLMARFAWDALRSAESLVRRRFHTDAARAFFAAIAGHSMMPLDFAGTAAVGLVLCIAGHAVGWPIARGGSQAITRALAAHLRELGGVIETDVRVDDVARLPPARATLFDVTPRQLLRIAGERLPDRYRRQLVRYRYGPAAFKLDWALSGPVTWRNPRCRDAVVLHLAGGFDEVVAAEHAPWHGQVAERPFVLFVQPTPFDPSRAPHGRHTAWAYCHVPNGSTTDMTAAIESQVERFAPGFRDLILARSVSAPERFEQHNPNLVGGDIGAGAATLRQLLLRPAPRWDPYRVPGPNNFYLCSAATPPGSGVHGMCGYHAAMRALKRHLR